MRHVTNCHYESRCLFSVSLEDICKETLILFPRPELVQHMINYAFIFFYSIEICKYCGSIDLTNNIRN
jgi:hypothetical protein